MARGSGDSLLTVVLLGVGGYLVYQWFQQHPGGITTAQPTVTPSTGPTFTYQGPMGPITVPAGSGTGPNIYIGPIQPGSASTSSPTGSPVTTATTPIGPDVPPDVPLSRYWY